MFRKQNTLRPSTALATVLALAGPFVLATEASAQRRPYASSGAYENVSDTDVTAGSAANYDYDANRQYSDISPKDALASQISPDILRPAQAPLDTDTQDAATAATDRLQQQDMRRRKLSRRSEQFYTDYESGGRKLWIKPYLEASQIVDSQLSPNSQTLTYSVLAVGADAAAVGPSYQGSASVRYERRFGYGRAQTFDNLSGVAHGIAEIVPNAVHLEAAGFASRVHVEAQGATAGGVGNPAANTQIYSVMAGPSIATDAGDLEVKGHYRIGYAHVGNPSLIAPPAGVNTRADIFDHSVVHDARLRVGTRPGDTLPVGLAVTGGHYREDISNLSQRARDSHIRGEVTVPIADEAAFVGGVGYEWVTVDSKDALRDAAGNPVISAKGRIITDQAGPRYIAFDTKGLIWDAGVIWRPSPKTNLEAHIGRRYGEFGGYGTFSYQPTRRSSFNVLVYNNMAGFGGMMTNSLANLPTQFLAIRDSLTGNVGACVSSASSGNCLSGALATVRSTVFRGRGVAATYNWAWSRFQAGVGAGLDHRQYIAAPGTILASLNRRAERYVWTAAYLNTAIDPHTNLTTTLDSYWFSTDVAPNADFNAVRATAILQHQFNRHLSGSAAVGVSGVNRQAIDDVWTMSGQVGMRYTF